MVIVYVFPLLYCYRFGWIEREKCAREENEKRPREALHEESGARTSSRRRRREVGSSSSSSFARSMILLLLVLLFYRFLGTVVVVVGCHAYACVYGSSLFCVSPFQYCGTCYVLEVASSLYPIGCSLQLGDPFAQP